MAAEVADGVEDIAARVDAQRLRTRLTEALAQLPPAERDVLLLHAWADLDHAEIGIALRIPIGTARACIGLADVSGNG